MERREEAQQPPLISRRESSALSRGPPVQINADDRSSLRALERKTYSIRPVQRRARQAAWPVRQGPVSYTAE